MVYSRRLLLLLAISLATLCLVNASLAPRAAAEDDNQSPLSKRGTKPLGSSCISNASCASGKCSKVKVCIVPGKNLLKDGKVCKKSASCQSGNCSKKRCTRKKSLSGKCTKANNCQSEYCNSKGRCAIAPATRFITSTKASATTLSNGAVRIISPSTTSAPPSSTISSSDATDSSFSAPAPTATSSDAKYGTYAYFGDVAIKKDPALSHSGNQYIETVVSEGKPAVFTLSPAMSTTSKKRKRDVSTYSILSQFWFNVYQFNAGQSGSCTVSLLLNGKQMKYTKVVDGYALKVYTNLTSNSPEDTNQNSNSIGAAVSCSSGASITVLFDDITISRVASTSSGSTSTSVLTSAPASMTTVGATSTSITSTSITSTLPLSDTSSSSTTSQMSTSPSSSTASTSTTTTSSTPAATNADNGVYYSVYNGGFEDQLNGWGINQVTLDHDNFDEGTKSALLTWNAGGSAATLSTNLNELDDDTDDDTTTSDPTAVGTTTSQPQQRSLLSKRYDSKTSYSLSYSSKMQLTLVSGQSAGTCTLIAATTGATTSEGSQVKKTVWNVATSDPSFTQTHTDPFHIDYANAGLEFSLKCDTSVDSAKLNLDAISLDPFDDEEGQNLPDYGILDGDFEDSTANSKVWSLLGGQYIEGGHASDSKLVASLQASAQSLPQLRQGFSMKPGTADKYSFTFTYWYQLSKLTTVNGNTEKKEENACQMNTYIGQGRGNPTVSLPFKTFYPGDDMSTYEQLSDTVTLYQDVLDFSVLIFCGSNVQEARVNIDDVTVEETTEAVIQYGVINPKFDGTGRSQQAWTFVGGGSIVEDVKKSDSGVKAARLPYDKSTTQSDPGLVALHQLINLKAQDKATTYALSLSYLFDSLTLSQGETDGKCTLFAVVDNNGGDLYGNPYIQDLTPPSSNTRYDTISNELSLPAGAKQAGISIGMECDPSVETATLYIDDVFFTLRERSQSPDPTPDPTPVPAPAPQSGILNSNFDGTTDADKGVWKVEGSNAAIQVDDTTNSLAAALGSSSDLGDGFLSQQFNLEADSSGKLFDFGLDYRLFNMEYIDAAKGGDCSLKVSIIDENELKLVDKTLIISLSNGYSYQTLLETNTNPQGLSSTASIDLIMTCGEDSNIKSTLIYVDNIIFKEHDTSKDVKPVPPNQDDPVERIRNGGFEESNVDLAWITSDEASFYLATADGDEKVKSGKGAANLQYKSAPDYLPARISQDVDLPINPKSPNYYALTFAYKLDLLQAMDGFTDPISCKLSPLFYKTNDVVDESSWDSITLTSSTSSTYQQSTTSFTRPDEFKGIIIQLTCSSDTKEAQVYIDDVSIKEAPMAL